ncbi:MAG TPA: hypothetical protein VGG27_06730 [Magnetospirillaceae bacterium]|jgi:hypothetical protein
MKRADRQASSVSAQKSGPSIAVTAAPLDHSKGVANMTIDQNIFRGRLTPDEAKAHLEWAQTQREFQEAYRNRSHLLHADYIQQVAWLHEVIAGIPAPADSTPASWPRNDTPQSRISRLRADAAYSDKHHPNHAHIMEQMSEAYRELYPDPKDSEGEKTVDENLYRGRLTADEAAAALTHAQGRPEYNAAILNARHPQHADFRRHTFWLREVAAGVPAPAGSTPASWPSETDPATRIATLQKSDAYQRGSHPGHSDAVRQMSEAYSDAQSARSPAPTSERSQAQTELHRDLNSNASSAKG